MSHYENQGIVTRYHKPTDTEGAHCSATIESGKQWYYPYDHKLSCKDNHARAARLMAEGLGWTGTWRGESIPGGYAFALEDNAMFTIPHKNR
jgi:hypothetical protein